jgi:hypothetical protein
MVRKLEKGSTISSSTPQQHIKINKSKIQEKEKGHATSHCPTKLKAQETISRREEDQSEGDCAIYAKRRVTRLRIGAVKSPPGQLDRVWPAQ